MDNIVVKMKDRGSINTAILIDKQITLIRLELELLCSMTYVANPCIKV
jgi:hypothetical protein